MPEPYIGEVRMFAGNFAPVGWMFCEGQTLSIAENEVLFTLIGTTYGGDGESTFNLPNLSSRVPLHMGTGSSGDTYTLGQQGGTEAETLTVQQIPTHTHALMASTALGTTPNPVGSILAQAPASIQLYIEDAPAANLSAAAIQPVGGSQPHTNVQPFLCINYIISLFGIFPSQT
jgi:microcystin-dependent protein